MQDPAPPAPLLAQAVWLPRLPPALAAAAWPGAATSGGSPRLAPHLLYLSLYHANLLANPWLSLEEQAAARNATGGDTSGRAKPPWLSVNAGGWAWGAPALEGLTTEPGAELPRSPAPAPPFSQLVRARGAQRAAQRAAAHVPCPPAPPAGTTHCCPMLGCCLQGLLRRPAGAVAASYYWSALVQAVDIVAALQGRGMPLAAARAFLDTGPPLELEVHGGQGLARGGRHAGVPTPTAPVCLHPPCRCTLPGGLTVPASLNAACWQMAGPPLCPSTRSCVRVQWLHTGGRCCVNHRWVSLASLSCPCPAVEAWQQGCAAADSTGEMSAVPQRWSRQQLRVEGYPPGVHRAVAVLRSKSGHLWAGHYGCKVAAPTLRFALPHPDLC